MAQDSSSERDRLVGHTASGHQLLPPSPTAWSAEEEEAPPGPSHVASLAKAPVVGSQGNSPVWARFLAWRSANILDN